MLKKISLKKLSIHITLCYFIENIIYVHYVHYVHFIQALILCHLTVDNKPTADYIVQFRDFFETEDDYYLVMEYIEGINLAEFTKKAHQYISDGKLKLKEFQKIVKYLFWQLTVCIIICFGVCFEYEQSEFFNVQIKVILHWIHDDMNVCHLDLTLENIMLQDSNFIINDKTGMVTINQSITVKLCDFGVSEMFRSDKMFKCMKHSLFLDDVHYLSPQLYDEQQFDARSADIWALGMMLFEVSIGRAPYIMPEYKPKPGSGYWAIQRKQIKQYLLMHDLTRYVNTKMMSLLKGLLDFDESTRFKSKDVLKHPWFKSYYGRYKQRINKKSVQQIKKLKLQTQKLKSFPFYGDVWSY